MIRLTSVILLLWLSAHACAQGATHQTKQLTLGQNVETALLRSIKYLKASQSKDGAWRSTKYGSMRQGAATTAFTVYAISHLPEYKQQSLMPEIKKAFAFLKKGIPISGSVSNPDGSLDYPVYCSAMLLTASHQMKLPLSVEEEKTLLSFLLKSQCNNQRGFKPDDPNYGGWDILGPETAPGKTTGTNVSVSRYVLEALQIYKDPTNKRRQALGLNKATGLRQQFDFANTIAKKWIENASSYSPDGGFCFTPHLGSTSNKAKTLPFQGEQRPRSYGSTTCDGLRILSICGVKPDDKRLVSAQNWISKQKTLDLVPGFSESDTSGWNKGLRFYYWAALAKSLDLFPKKFRTDQHKLIHKKIISLQLENGSWENSANHMREDEPLIATGFALIALSSK